MTPPHEPGLFAPEGDPPETDRVLVEAYVAEGRTLDDLPYTDALGRVLTHYVERTADAPAPTRATLFRRLHNLRKAGRLPKLGRAAGVAGKPVRLSDEHEATLIGLVEQAVGKLTSRDRLAETDAFAELAARFQGDTGLSVSLHDLWRVVAKLGKRARPDQPDRHD